MIFCLPIATVLIMIIFCRCWRHWIGSRDLRAKNKVLSARSISKYTIYVTTLFYDWWLCIALFSQQSRVHEVSLLESAGLGHLVLCAVFALFGIVILLRRCARHICLKRNVVNLSLFPRTFGGFIMCIICCVQPHLVPLLLPRFNATLIEWHGTPHAHITLGSFAALTSLALDTPQLAFQSTVIYIHPNPRSRGTFIAEGHRPAVLWPALILSCLSILLSILTFISVHRDLQIYRAIHKMSDARPGMTSARSVYSTQSQVHSAHAQGAITTQQQSLFLSWMLSQASPNTRNKMEQAHRSMHQDTVSGMPQDMASFPPGDLQRTCQDSDNPENPCSTSSFSSEHSKPSSTSSSSSEHSKLSSTGSSISE